MTSQQDTELKSLLAKARATIPDGTEIVLMVDGDLNSGVPLEQALASWKDKEVIKELERLIVVCRRSQRYEPEIYERLESLQSQGGK